MTVRPPPISSAFAEPVADQLQWWLKALPSIWCSASHPTEHSTKDAALQCREKPHSSGCTERHGDIMG